MANCKFNSQEAEAVLRQDKILGAALRAAGDLKNLNIENGYVLDSTVAEVAKLAEAAGFMYDQGKGFFYTNAEGDKTKASVNQIHEKIKEDYGSYTDTNLFSKEELATYDAAEQESGITYNKGFVSDDISTIFTISDLKDANINMVAPAVSESSNYEYRDKEYYRTTASLGFSVAKSKRGQVLKNAAAIGNFVDEVGKRVFRGDDPATISYEDINKFVKEESRLRNIKEGEVDLHVWEILYKNPVSREGYEELTNSLVAMKNEMQEKYNIKEFHTDIVVWDNEKRIAGEVDVLAEHPDGSFTVIDLKSRKGGLEEYSRIESERFNDKSKHTMQTNTYSNMLAKMGFKLNAPLIIMARPIHPKDKEAIVDETSFRKVTGEETLTLIELERREDNVVKLNVGEKGAIPPLLLTYYESTTSAYNLWLRKKKAGREKANPKLLQVDDLQKERLQKRLKAIKESLISFKNISKANLSAVTITDELDSLIEKLDVASQYSLDENLLHHQIAIAGNFFAYAANQLNELHDVLKYPASTQEERKTNYIKIMNYKGVFKTSQELFEQLEVIKNDLGVEESEIYETVRSEFFQFAGINANLSTDLNIARKSLFLEMVTEAYLGSKGEIKMNNKFRKEAEKLYRANELYKEDGSAYANQDEAVEAYLNKKKRDPQYIDDVKEAMRAELEELINNPSRDVSKVSFFLNSDIMVNNDYVQVFHKMLMNAEQRYSTTANEEVIKLSQLHSEVKLSRREIDALIDTDYDGNMYLVSDYKIEFYNKKEKFRQDGFAINKKIDATTDVEERSKLVLEAETLAVEHTNWYEKNTVHPELTDKDGKIIPNTEDKEVRIPISKWETDYTQYSSEQLKALEAFKAISDLNDGRIGTRTLKKGTSARGAVYYKLPGVLRTQFGHAVRGQLIKGAKKAYEESTEIELGDVEEGQGATKATSAEDELKPQRIRRAYTGLDGKPAFYTPIFFRASPKERQNTDLFTIYAMELQNGIRYEIDSKLAIDSTIFLDTVKGATFFASVGIERSFNKSVYAPEDSDVVDTMSGEIAVVTRMIEKMMKSRVYSITQEYGGTVANKDINRIIGAVSSYTTFAAMSFRGLSAANNWLTGNVAAALEAAGGEFITAKSMSKAKAEYYSNLPGIVGDIGAQVKRNRVNQMIAILDVQGNRDILNNEFERTNKVTQLLKSGTALATYAMGEHEIHATVMLGVLNEIRIINSKGQWLTKEGKVTSSRSKAASVSDAFVTNKAGILEIASWAEYSEFDTVNKLTTSNGLATVRDLIKDRVTRTQGAFDSRLQADLNRHWYGKLFFQFKKHMPPQILNRFRGAAHTFTKTDNLRDSDKYFNLHAKTEEYGYYVSFVRFLHSVIKQEKMNIFSYMKAGKNEWRDNMNKHERANVIKTMSELSFIVGTLVLAGMAMAAADDDDEALWALAYLLRRQTNEGGLQYLNPMENWRVVNSPMAAVGKLGNLSDTLVQLYSPTEEYETGELKGQSKLKVKAMRSAILGPVMDQFASGYPKKIFNSLTQ